MATMIPSDIEEFGTETEFVGLLGLFELLGLLSQRTEAKPSFLTGR